MTNDYTSDEANRLSVTHHVVREAQAGLPGVSNGEYRPVRRRS